MSDDPPPMPKSENRKKPLPQGPLAKQVLQKKMPVEQASSKVGAVPKHVHQTMLVQGPPCTVFSMPEKRGATPKATAKKQDPDPAKHGPATESAKQTVPTPPPKAPVEQKQAAAPEPKQLAQGTETQKTVPPVPPVAAPPPMGAGPVPQVPTRPAMLMGQGMMPMCRGPSIPTMMGGQPMSMGGQVAGQPVPMMGGQPMRPVAKQPMPMGGRPMPMMGGQPMWPVGGQPMPMGGQPMPVCGQPMPIGEPLPKEWSKPQPGHKHNSAQVRRGAGQRERMLREHFQALLDAQREHYEAQLLLLRAESVAYQAIMVAGHPTVQQPQEQPQEQPNEPEHQPEKKHRNA